MSRENWMLQRRLVDSGFAIALFLFSAVGIAAYLRLQGLRQDQQWVEHTYQVLEAIGKTQTALAEATLGRRGFILAQDNTYLSTYEIGVQQTQIALATLEQLTIDNPNQHQRVQQLKPLVNRRLQELQRSIALMKQNPQDKTTQLRLTLQGQHLQDLIEQTLAQLDASERTLLAQRFQAAQNSAHASQAILLSGSLLGFGLLIGVYSLLRQEVHRRGQAEETLQQLNADLECRVQERTTQLSQSNASLLAEVLERKRAEVELQQTRVQLEQRVEARTAELSQTNRQLQESETKFRNAFDNAPIGIALLGLDGRWLKVNPPLCEIVGYSEAELLAQTFQTITHPDDLETDLSYVHQLLTGEIRRYEIKKRYIHKRGHIVWVLLSKSLIRDSEGTAQYFISHIQDITEQRMIEQIKNEFISVVSHELRTPLTSIRGSLGLLATGIYDHKPDKARRMIEIAQTDTERLYRLVNDILDLERLESGKITLVKERCEVEMLLRRSAEAMQASADAAGIAIAVQPIAAQVLAAPDAIIQTLTNLLSNAIKFSEPGGTIWLSAIRRQRDGMMASNGEPASHPGHPALLSTSDILFTVKDQGRGIPPDKLDAIFGRFQQVDASDARHKGGTGLGLAICRSIIQQHGGRIWAESPPGEGSTFYFTLPA